MHPNEELLERFYTSFQRKDSAGMAACYHPEITFSDPVFRDLKGPKAAAMWEMLTGRAKDIQITFRDIRADDQRGQAHWEAKYTYSATGRSVLNSVEGHFQFQDGKIRVHQDEFDFWRWASQALGMSGRLLGWAPFFHNAVSRKAMETLDTYMTQRAK